ncbi:Uncharacterised protein [Mycobacteroides abscessus subsp. abscessus]|uniref:hypothetical protein n=1 Tax=Mycobacteroides abscessus TaxID=36809 RepID=UPI00092B9C63|nr:hypothetical protein [Mycobacteroides abscessus]SHT46600.1 Uncharacterised protein [Mycobacteroides abscessus subsp. abscessus]SHW32869.1 Uncharacterised protein [Mycobacteroides abscessus subsp. abscessus]SIF91775.1 Uncharacterised protein [Mycobacteroides abscessus subsp. abscessus]SKD17759.1 Uncharacterised protein [Mycobacteroides abscessus subsp. abscessus]SKM23075.1 Uncharacterised protein [Mycobacteroides abscessus subsp. abscessus]
MFGTDTTPTDRDLLKYAVAVGAGGANELQGVVSQLPELRGSGIAAWAELVARLEALSNELLALLAGGEDDLDWYEAGHAVYTIVEQPDCDCIRVHTWHPDPRHERNRPRDLAVLACPRGGFHRLVVVGLGEVETVDLGALDEG